MPPRQRHHVKRLVALVAAILVLALGVTGADHVLLASRATTPRATSNVPATAPTMPTSSSPTPGATASPGVARMPTATHVVVVGGGMPTVAPTVAPTAMATPTTAPVPTATPLRTPTMVVSSSPLAFQPYPTTGPKNCVATQKLTNVSAVNAQWTWTNAPNANWQYNFTSLSSTSWYNFPATKTTAANSSDYVYIKTGLDSTTTGGYCTKLNTVATISVSGGSGTKFSVSY